MKQLAKEINRLCAEYRSCCGDVECRGKAEKVRRELVRLCEVERKEMRIEKLGLLVALLDAYEVTRDEGMLQEVLDVVSGNLERLEVSAEAVRLLAYCGYYTEEKECVEWAKGMLAELKRQGEDTEGLEAELADWL